MGHHTVELRQQHRTKQTTCYLVNVGLPVTQMNCVTYTSESCCEIGGGLEVGSDNDEDDCDALRGRFQMGESGKLVAFLRQALAASEQANKLQKAQRKTAAHAIMSAAYALCQLTRGGGAEAVRLAVVQRLVAAGVLDVLVVVLTRYHSAKEYSDALLNCTNATANLGLFPSDATCAAMLSSGAVAALTGLFKLSGAKKVAGGATVQAATCAALWNLAAAMDTFATSAATTAPAAQVTLRSMAAALTWPTLLRLLRAPARKAKQGGPADAGFLEASAALVWTLATNAENAGDLLREAGGAAGAAALLQSQSPDARGSGSGSAPRGGSARAELFCVLAASQLLCHCRCASHGTGTGGTAAAGEATTPGTCAPMNALRLLVSGFVARCLPASAAARRLLDAEWDGSLRDSLLRCARSREPALHSLVLWLLTTLASCGGGAGSHSADSDSSGTMGEEKGGAAKAEVRAHLVQVLELELEPELEPSPRGGSGGGSGDGGSSHLVTELRLSLYGCSAAARGAHGAAAVPRGPVNRQGGADKGKGAESDRSRQSSGGHTAGIGIGADLLGSLQALPAQWSGRDGFGLGLGSASP